MRASLSSGCFFSLLTIITGDGDADFCTLPNAVISEFVDDVIDNGVVGFDDTPPPPPLPADALQDPPAPPTEAEGSSEPPPPPEATPAATP